MFNEIEKYRTCITILRIAEHFLEEHLNRVFVAVTCRDLLLLIEM